MASCIDVERVTADTLVSQISQIRPSNVSRFDYQCIFAVYNRSLFLLSRKCEAARKMSEGQLSGFIAAVYRATSA
nr:unnamed protein product [Spirometra erinaceieuropaei]